MTTEITALPRGNSLQERENDAEANTQYRTVPTLVEEVSLINLFLRGSALTDVHRAGHNRDHIRAKQTLSAS